MCHSCATVRCRHNYPEGIPAYCMAARHQGILETTKKDYRATATAEIYAAAGRTAERGDGKWPRVQEAIEFAKELKLSKIGLASCVMLIRELGLVAELFTGAGFQVVTVGCQIGRVSPHDRGAPTDVPSLRHFFCNPIAQAEIMNSEGTELNYIMGLCLGHDILFMRHAKAPTSVLIVKDRVTGHNPAAALYTNPHRRALWKLYCGKDID